MAYYSEDDYNNQQQDGETPDKTKTCGIKPKGAFNFNQQD